MVLCLVSVVNAHVEIIIPMGGWERFCQPKPSGCERHTSGVKVNYQMNSQAFRILYFKGYTSTLLQRHLKVQTKVSNSFISDFSA